MSKGGDTPTGLVQNICPSGAGGGATPWNTNYQDYPFPPPPGTVPFPHGSPGDNNGWPTNGFRSDALTQATA